MFKTNSNHLVHVGLPKTGTSFLQTDLWPNISESKSTFIYAGKNFIQKNYMSGATYPIKEFYRLRKYFDIDFDIFEPDARKLVINSLYRSYRAWEGGGKSLIFSDEAMTSPDKLHLFRNRLTIFKESNIDCHFLLFLRDIKDFLKSLGPSILILERRHERLTYIADRDQKIDIETALRILYTWLIREANRHKNNKPSIISTLLDFQNIITTLGEKNTTVIKYSPNLQDHAGFGNFIQDFFSTPNNFKNKNKRNNTRTDSWSQIIKGPFDIEKLEFRFSNMIEAFYRDFLRKQSAISESEEILRKMNTLNYYSGISLIENKGPLP